MEKIKISVELRSLNNLIRRYFEFSSHRREIDSVTGNNGWIIGYLANNTEKDIYQKDIEDHFTITRSTASKVLSLMEQKGLVQRMPVMQDARLKKIVLTDKSLEIRELMMEDAQKLENTLTKGFTEEELITFRSYIKRMKQNICESHDKI